MSIYCIHISMDTLLGKFHCLTHESHTQSFQRQICLQHFPQNFGLLFSAVKIVLPNCIIFQLRKHDREQVMWVFHELCHLWPLTCFWENISWRVTACHANKMFCNNICSTYKKSVKLRCQVSHKKRSPKRKGT